MARRTRFSPALLMGLLLATTSSLASDYQVSPVRVDIHGRVRTAVLTVHNQGQEPLRLQVSAFSWEQTPRGEIQLDATQDVSFFPSLLTLEPGQTRNVRVGVASGAGDAERTYRLIIEQLPPRVRDGSEPPGVRVLTRMSIPIFVAPVSKSSTGVLEKPCTREGTLAFAVRNTGSTHFMVREVRVRGLDAQGSVVMEQQLPGWYVLAGGRREYALPLEPRVAHRVERFTIDAHTNGPTLSTQTGEADRTCPW
ncbi:fimbrial biogenesis chaperone [Myxococcus sp. Y35]|uniref:fimbrial biogenesis chaperone n=1 Tax=Pseudomyxococcus flavus TaxID=3115648 RepID=UPI003CE82F02